MYIFIIINICFFLYIYFRGVNYERVVLNLLKVHCDPGNLIIVINSADYEEKYYRNHLDAKYIHASSTNGNERYVVAQL